MLKILARKAEKRRKNDVCEKPTFAVLHTSNQIWIKLTGLKFNIKVVQNPWHVITNLHKYSLTCKKVLGPFESESETLENGEKTTYFAGKFQKLACQCSNFEFLPDLWLCAWKCVALPGCLVKLLWSVGCHNNYETPGIPKSSQLAKPKILIWRDTGLCACKNIPSSVCLLWAKFGAKMTSRSRKMKKNSNAQKSENALLEMNRIGWKKLTCCKDTGLNACKNIPSSVSMLWAKIGAKMTSLWGITKMKSMTLQI